jgi:holo-[acyl-carrier protein] synthase
MGGGVVGIGVDLVDVGRLERLLEQWPGMAGRLFTPAERAYAAGRHRPAEHLAARFAAKEATFKALGAGWPAIGWHDVEVARTDAGPRLLLSGRAAQRAGGARSLVSLSHEGGMAIAQVLLLAPPGTVVEG